MEVPFKTQLKLGPVHTYPDIFESANFFLLDTATVHTDPVNPAYESSTFWIRTPEWKFLNPLCTRKRVDAKSGYSFRRHKIESSSLPWVFKTVRAKKKLRIQKYQDTCGRAYSIWIRLCVGVEIFVSRKKKLRIQKYPYTCLNNRHKEFLSPWI